MKSGLYSELVFGLTAPIGVDCRTIIEQLEQQVKSHNWHPHLINTSSLVLNESSFKDSREQETGLTALRISSKQSEYYEKIDPDSFLTSLNAAVIIDHIKERREEEKLKCLEKKCHGIVYIINMLVDDKDSEQLKDFYEHGYYQIGITDNEENRKKNLDKIFKASTYSSTSEQNFARVTAERIDKREIEKVFIHSDLFIDASKVYNDKIERFVDLVFGAPNISPTHSEYAMFMAFMASVDSADLSRQVGAVISSRNKDIVSTGSNDVQKAGGGKYWPDPTYKPLSNENFGMFNDKRDAAIGYDANAKKISQLSKDIAEALIEQIPEISIVERDKLESVLRNKTGLKDITEFGRVVHAELAAIMSALRNQVSIKDAQLFCTTFPCHNCAKHIVASGIKRVEYIEPYPKSKALDLHNDSISVGDDNNDKVVFSAFSGVGPNRFLDLFSTMGLGAAKKIDRKNDQGNAIPTERGKYYCPRIPVSLEKLIYMENRKEILQNIFIAKQVISESERLFEKYYESYIKVFKGGNELNMIERVNGLSEGYPYDYGFSLKVVDKKIANELFKGLCIRFKLKAGNTRLLLANSIEPIIEKRASDGCIMWKCVGVARKSSDGKWYIDKLIESHPSNYLINNLSSLKSYIDDKSEIQVYFTLVHNFQGLPYEAKKVMPFKKS